MQGQLRIASLFAFVMVDNDGTEGVPAVGGVPLVGADLARVAALRPIAQSIATATGKPVTLAHFSVRTNQETILP